MRATAASRPTEVYFFVAGTPVPQPRPRVATRDRHGRALARARAYETGPIVEWKRTIAIEAKRRWFGRPEIRFPVSVTLTFLFARPKRVPLDSVCTNRVDVDNLAKPVLDVLQIVSVLLNDRLVTELVARKLYVSGPADRTGVAVALRWTER